jgi:branched-subunit amino acid transport protein AzlD
MKDKKTNAIVEKIDKYMPVAIIILALLVASLV